MVRKWKLSIVATLICIFSMTTVNTAYAGGIAEIIKQAIIKIIKAIDLKIQQMQNKTLSLENIQKELENLLTKLKLDQIGDWTKKQKDQYEKYFEELKKIKSAIANYKRVKEIAQKQARLVREYEHVWQLLRSDNHFTTREIDYMGRVYSGILDESLKNIKSIDMVITSFSTQMTDGERLKIINEAAEKIDRNYNDLRRFNQQNKLLSLQRAKGQHEVDKIKQLYGLD